MGKIILCDMCNAEDASAMWTSLTDGTVVSVGEQCVIMFITGLAVAMDILPDPTATPADNSTTAARPKRSRRGQSAEGDPEAPSADAGAVTESVEA